MHRLGHLQQISISLNFLFNKIFFNSIVITAFIIVFLLSVFFGLGMRDTIHIDSETIIRIAWMIRNVETITLFFVKVIKSGLSS